MLPEKFPYDDLSQELIALLRKNKGLPKKGLVKLVLEKCPSWRKHEKGSDPRGAGNAIGRRLRRLRNAGKISETDDKWTVGY